MPAAEREYERLMAESFAEANRVLKQNGEMTIVYAHKTTLGWATLVDAMRKAGFIVTEAWPLDTEKPGRLVAQGSAALASSIFLIARKRTPSSKAGNYETDVVPELGSIVRERVDTLWEMGISGADLVIACVGAGLRAFTKYARVEYGNDEEVPAERFLAEVETVVLEAILGKLSKTVGSKNGQTTLAGLDPVFSGATPTAPRNWTPAKLSSSPTEHTLNWMDSIALPRATAPCSKRRRASTGCTITRSAATKTRLASRRRTALPLRS